MFLHGWQQAVEQVFLDFPEAGMVSPVPSSSSKVFEAESVSTTFYYGFLRRILKFERVRNPQGLVKFQESIGRKIYSESHLDNYLILCNKNRKAVLGCGHFVATIKAEVFHYAPDLPSYFKIEGGSETKYIDNPNNNAGYLRLATLDNYAYHLGNKIEPWMLNSFNEVNNSKNLPFAVFEDRKINGKPLNKYSVYISKILRKILVKIKPFKIYYLKLLGMNDPNY